MHKEDEIAIQLERKEKLLGQYLKKIEELNKLKTNSDMNIMQILKTVTAKTRARLASNNSETNKVISEHIQEISGSLDDIILDKDSSHGSDRNERYN